jgi:hypothetical protein
MRSLVGVLGLIVVLCGFTPGAALAVQSSEGGTAKAPKADSEERENPLGSGESTQEHGSGIRDTGTHQRSSKLSFFGILPWYYGFGIGAGARYELPIVHDGFIPTLNDSFELEFGADVWYGSVAFDGGYTGVTVPVEGKWSFHLAPKLAVYGKLGLGWSFYFYSDSFVNASGGGFHLNGATGAIYQLSDTFWLRGELGYSGLKLGVSLKF